jgi:topoisomerase IA-like protein
MSRAQGGLTKWFKEEWVDLGRKKKDGSYASCGRKKASLKSKGYPKCVPKSKAARMTEAEKKSAVKRKRAKTQGVGGKPTNVKTIASRKKKKKRSRKA